VGGPGRLQATDSRADHPLAASHWPCLCCVSTGGEAYGPDRGDPFALATAHDQMAQTRATPWYRDTVALDRERMAQITTCIEGRPAAPSAEPAAVVFRLMRVAMMYDADIVRALNEIMGLLAPIDAVLARLGMADRIREIARGREAMAPRGPSRAEVLAGLA
jgi:hypothetical protein